MDRNNTPLLSLSCSPQAVSTQTSLRYWGALVAYWSWSTFLCTSSSLCRNHHRDYLIYGFWLLLLCASQDRSNSKLKRILLSRGVSKEHIAYLIQANFKHRALSFIQRGLASILTHKFSPISFLLLAIFWDSLIFIDAPRIYHLRIILR